MAQAIVGKSETSIVKTLNLLMIQTGVGACEAARHALSCVGRNENQSEVARSPCSLVYLRIFLNAAERLADLFTAIVKEV